ncbi:oxidoreductase-like domain-containing protein 1 [Anas acuta]|uniref:oxidoreductase-like domain-containing protein 1 n=1 Tax=Anas acuta TaxID=28680 RepID=UPI0035C89EEA
MREGAGPSVGSGGGMWLRGARGARGLAGGRRGDHPGAPHPGTTFSTHQMSSDTPGRDNSGEGGSDPSGSDHQAETSGNEGSETPFSAPPPDLEPPSNCCMSGCANCVWIQHVERLLRHYGDGGERALEAVERHVQDESIKMLLRTEIRLRAKKD